MQQSFFNRRLHSLLGIIPVGFFLVEHLLTNYMATKGADEFVKQVNWIFDIPFLLTLEILFIFLPLLYHAGYGIYISFQAKNNVTNYGSFRNWMFTLQRVTGLITFFFIGWHVWETRIQKAIYDLKAHDLARETALMLQDNITFVLYVIGILATIFHFSNGIWSFLVSWGITVGPRAQLISTWACSIFFLIVSYIGIRALLAFTRPEFIQQLAQ